MLFYFVVQVGDPYLDVERARLCVSTLIEHFTARKNTIASRWNDWETVVSQNRHATLLWERNMTDTNKVCLSMSTLYLKIIFFTFKLFEFNKKVNFYFYFKLIIKIYFFYIN